MTKQLINKRKSKTKHVKEDIRIPLYTTKNKKVLNRAVRINVNYFGSKTNI